MTTIQILVLPGNSTFDEPTTPSGLKWKAALNYLSTCPKWSSTAWGRHLEAPDHVTILIDWVTIPAAQVFLTTYYHTFATLISPLLAEPSSHPESHYVTDLNACVVEPAAAPGGKGGLTTMTKLSFSSLTADQRFNLLPPTFDCYVQFLEQAAEGFKGGHASWAIWGEEKTLWMATSWETLEAEEKCEKTMMVEDGRTQKEASLGRLFEKADSKGREIYHVKWEMVNKDIMQWWMNSDNSVWPYIPLKDK